MFGGWANCSSTRSLPLLGLNLLKKDPCANDPSLILSRRGAPGFVSARGSCAPSPDSGVLPMPPPPLFFSLPLLPVLHLLPVNFREIHIKETDVFFCVIFASFASPVVWTFLGCTCMGDANGKFCVTFASPLRNLRHLFAEFASSLPG